MTRTARIVYHGHCFDGMASAAVLTRVLRSLEGADLRFSYRGVDHQPGGSHVPEELLDCDLNAVVDFRYTTSQRLDYWFDHHASGIANAREREHFRADRSGHKFFDPQYGSCCQLIADVSRDRFRIRLDDLAPLIADAQMIDSASFPDARTAVSLQSAALQWMTVIEVHGDDGLLAPAIAALADGAPLESLARGSAIQRLFAPLRAEHEATRVWIAQHARTIGDVVLFDLVGRGSDRFNKFIAYEHFPQARYAIGVSAGASRAKVSVGSNPWAASPATADIAAICSRYGGGGHRAVGAISLQPHAIDRARAIAEEIARELAG